MEDKLFDKYSFQYENNFLLSDEGFRKALTEYQQSILTLVDEEIDKHKKMRHKYLDNNLEYYGLAGAKISTLAELKQKIEAL